MSGWVELDRGKRRGVGGMVYRGSGTSCCVQITGVNCKYCYDLRNVFNCIGVMYMALKGWWLSYLYLIKVSMGQFLFLNRANKA